MKNIIVLLYLGLNSCVFAQNYNFKWNSISDQELKFTKVNFDEDAEAVILYEKGMMNIDNQYYVLNVRRRIKLLNEKGLDEANVKFEYYAKEGIEKVSQLKARIYAPNSNAKSIELSNKDFTDVAQNRAWNEISFTLPNAQIGSIIEYEYTLTSKHNWSIDAWHFQHELPTLQSEFDFSQNTSSIQYVSILIGEQMNQKYGNRHPDKVWSIANIPSINKVKFLYNPKDQVEGLRLQAKGYFGYKEDFYKNEPEYKTILDTWPNLIREHLKRIETFKSNAITKEVANQISNGSNESETLQNILKYFNSTFRWDNFYSITPEKTFGNVWKDKSGNQADLNYLLNEVLKYKGIKATLVIFSPRQDGRLLLSYPYIYQFKAMNNFVELKNGEAMLIDASRSNFHKINFAPIENYNQRFLLLDNNINSFFISINQPISELNIREDYRGQYQKTFSRTATFSGDFSTNWVDEHFRISNVDATINTEKNEQQAEGNTRITHKSSDVVGKISSIFNPLKTLINEYNFFEGKRYHDIEFQFPFYINYEIYYELAEGQKVSLTNFKQEFSNNSGMKYYQNGVVKNNKLVLTYQLLIPKSIFEGKETPEIKSFFDRLQQLSDQRLSVN